MKMGRIIRKGFLFFVLMNGLLFPQKIDVKTAVNLALENNYRIKQYEERLKIKQTEDLSSWGNFLPTINFNWSYNHINNPLIIDLDPIRQVVIQLQSANQGEFANIYNILAGKPPLTNEQKAGIIQNSIVQLDQKIPHFKETLKEQDFKSSSFVGVMPIFMGLKLISAKKLTGYEKNVADYELIKTKNEVVSEVINAYLTCVFLESVVKLREDVLDGMRQHYSRAKKLFDEGIISQNNLLRAEVAVAEAERNYFDDKNKLELAYLSLKNLCNIPETTKITIDEKIQFTNFEFNIKDLSAKVEQDQPVLKIIQNKKEVVNQKYNIDKANFLPQVYAFGKYEIYPEYLSALEPRWTVGIQANINLFNGFKDYLKLQVNSYLEDEITNLENETRTKLNLWINKALTEYKNSINKYYKLESNIKLAKENLRSNEKRFESGMGTSLDVIDARLVLEKNELEKLNTIFENLKALNEIYLVIGEPEKFLTIWDREK